MLCLVAVTVISLVIGHCRCPDADMPTDLIGQIFFYIIESIGLFIGWNVVNNCTPCCACNDCSL